MVKDLFGKEKQVTGPGKRPLIVRRQQCKGCDTVLAIEITDKLGFRAFSEYYWLKYTAGVVLWVKERWYGNRIKCPVCGLEGNLPMDKPLSAEQIEKSHTENAHLTTLVHDRLNKKIKEARDNKRGK